MVQSHKANRIRSIDTWRQIRPNFDKVRVELSDRWGELPFFAEITSVWESVAYVADGMAGEIESASGQVVPAPQPRPQPEPEPEPEPEPDPEPDDAQGDPLPKHKRKRVWD